MSHLGEEDFENVPVGQPDWAKIEREGDEMVDFFMSQPMSAEEEATLDRMAKNWFPQSALSICEKNCRGCKALACPKEVD